MRTPYSPLRTHTLCQSWTVLKLQLCNWLAAQRSSHAFTPLGTDDTSRGLETRRLLTESLLVLERFLIYALYSVQLKPHFAMFDWYSPGSLALHIKTRNAGDAVSVYGMHYGWAGGGLRQRGVISGVMGVLGFLSSPFLNNMNLLRYWWGRGGSGVRGVSWRRRELHCQTLLALVCRWCMHHTHFPIIPCGFALFYLRHFIYTLSLTT